MIEQLMRAWAEAERKANPDGNPPWNQVSNAYKEIVRERVRQVMEGDIRRRHMSPGDEAVHLGRLRSAEKKPPQDVFDHMRDLSKPMNKTDLPWTRTGYGVGSYDRGVWWDSLEIVEHQPIQFSERLFDGKHCGFLNRTNMQMPHMLSQEHPVCKSTTAVSTFSRESP